ncbi:MAG TPA: hypothetical protein VF170_18160 [Planctomycetaceae bacterium]
MSAARLVASSLLLAGLVAGCGRGTASVEPGRLPSSPSAAPAAEARPTPAADDVRDDPAASASVTQTTPAAANAGEATAPAAEPVFRPDDDRPRHDDAALGRLGVRRLESRRLVLYTDIAPELAEGLPPLVDALYDDWVAYFGALPPARDGSEFQVTGYLMADADRFAAAGLLPEDLPRFDHGRHRGRRFWMRDQEYDYFRRHLLLHEATHCFMTLLPGSDGPVWYMEGMAEHFGTHRLGEGGPRFRVLPTSPEEFAGMGRITLVRQEAAAGRFLTLDDLFALRPEEFLETTDYAWSWAACHFFDRHPRYRDRFRALGDPRLRREFAEEFRRRFGPDAAELAVEWAAFAHTLRYGYDLERAAIEFRPGEPLSEAGATTAVAADRGWQSSGVRVEAGGRYAIAAEGRFTLADEPKPWVSDAGGISFDYFDGRPLGRLLAAVLADDPSDASDPAGGLLRPLDVGRGATLAAPAAGTLYFRVNDRWDRLGDNRGSLDVTIRPAGE